MIFGLNKTFNDMDNIAKETAKTALLEAYYTAAALDNSDGGLSKNEWKRMLNRLSTRQQEVIKEWKFEEIAGKDGIIDIKEFEDWLEKITAKMDNDLVDELK